MPFLNILAWPGVHFNRRACQCGFGSQVPEIAQAGSECSVVTG